MVDKDNIQEEMMDNQHSPRGRGWFGNPKAHAEAGRKGGLARSRKYNNKK
ncbi:hypothetical protein KKA69_02535 [Patescibacteria group bacterium]|nr:hypothetical protein [Patescibacteria group bacterium]